MWKHRERRKTCFARVAFITPSKLPPRGPQASMSTAEWKAVLSATEGKNLPLDLQHAVDSFASARQCFKASLGLLVLWLCLKLPTPRDDFMRAWQSRRTEGDLERVFHSLQDLARKLAKHPCQEETTEVGGPLHAHGWQALLQKLFVVKSATGSGQRVLHLGNGGKGFQLCLFSQEAREGIAAFLGLHQVLETLFCYGPPGHVAEWQKPATALAAAFRHYKIPGLMSGPESYCVDWVIRSFVVSWMRSEGINQLQLSATTKLEDLNGPDAGHQNRKNMVRVTGAVTAEAAFNKVGYQGPPELFTMWLCLLKPLVSGKKKRKELEAAPAGKHFYAKGRFFQTPTEFLRKNKKLTSAKCSGYQQVIEHTYLKKDTLVVINADNLHYSKQLPEQLYTGQRDAVDAGAAFLLADLPKRFSSVNSLYVYDVNAMEQRLAKARKAWRPSVGLAARHVRCSVLENCFARP